LEIIQKLHKRERIKIRNTNRWIKKLGKNEMKKHDFLPPNKKEQIRCKFC
jgi:hypothetical protein